MVPADHLLVCGVSNWGGSALAAAVLLLRKNADDAAIVATSGVDDVDRGGSLLWSRGMPSDEEDTAVLEAMVGCNSIDSDDADARSFHVDHPLPANCLYCPHNLQLLLLLTCLLCIFFILCVCVCVCVFFFFPFLP